MKRVFKLTLNEIKHLKWTVLVTALALTLFTASLFSVVFVYLDLTDNILGYFDTFNEPLSIRAQNVSIREAGLTNGHGLFSGEIENVTEGNAVVSANGREFAVKQSVTDDNGVIHLTIHSADAVYVTDEYAESAFENYGITGQIQTVNSVCLNRIVADKLQANVNDYVSIGGNRYKVVSVFEEEFVDGFNEYSVISAFTVFVDENAVFSDLRIQKETSRQTYDLLLNLQRKGISAEYAGGFKTYVDNLSLVNAFLIAVTITIFAVNALILYATVSVILANRRAYVCRLKTLGATNGLISATYYLILFVLVAVICVAAFFLSQLIVNSTMGACEQAFETSFTVNVNFGVAAVYFAVTAALLALLCVFSVRKIDDKACIAAARSD